MLDGITQWIKYIILVVMFTSFVGFLLPQNHFLKYANVLLGLIVMMTIATPLITLMKYDFTLDDLQWIFEGANEEQEVILQTDILTTTNEAIILRQYKKHVDSAICRDLQGLSSLEVVDVNTFIVEGLSQEDFGNISGVEVIIRSKEPGEKASVAVEKIVVGSKRKNTDHIQVPSEIPETADIARIREYLQSQLGLPEEKITLQWEG